MKTPREEKIERLFHEAASLHEEERVAFLEKACAGDASLREEVESLLVFAADGGALESPAIQAIAHVTPTPVAPRFEGRKIGAYRIEKELGRGGMGIVYRASRDGDPSQPVAIKIAKPDAESRHAVARLARERRLLSELEHPHIAKLLDGGETEEGLPYLVMEFIEGAPIHRFCDQMRLTLDERVALLLSLCEAIALAHRRGILHRDLKPTNILVTKEGAPKLLDFGLAKRFRRAGGVAHGATTLTEPDARALTPEYASPEQIRGEELRPSSDLYSLAVVLYELLAGRRPHERWSPLPHEIERAICEDEPEPPSLASLQGAEILALSGGATSESPEWVAARRNMTAPALAREIARRWDAPLLRALRRNPEKRFASAEEFAAALRAGLRPTWTSRVRGALSRARYRAHLHRARLAAGLLAASLLAGAVAFANWALDPSRQSAQQKVVAGLFEMGFAMHARGDDPSAESMYLVAQEVQKRFFGENDPGQANALNALGALAFGSGDFEKSEKRFREALSLLRRTLPAGHPSLTGTLIGLGMLLNDAGRFAESEPLLAECLEIAGKNSALPAWLAPIARGELGFCRFRLGKTEEGKRLLLAAVPEILTMWDPNHEQSRRAKRHLEGL